MATVGEIVGEETAAELRQASPHKPADEEPTSREQAKRELAALGIEVQDIVTHLSVRTAVDFPGYAEFADWRKRTVLAKNHKERRRAFLKEWLRRHQGPRGKGRTRETQHYEQYVHDVRTSKAKAASEAALDEIPLTVFLRQAARRVGMLEAVYRAALAYIDEDTDETWQGLLDVTERTRVIFADPFGTEDERWGVEQTVVEGRA